VSTSLTEPTVGAGTDRRPDAGRAPGDPGAVGEPGRIRAVIERVTPIVDGGRFPIKRIVDDVVRVEADAFADGHDVVEARLLHRHAGDAR